MTEHTPLIRVAIVDDQAMVRTGIRMVVDHADDMTVVGEAADGIEAIELVTRSTPDVVLMDIRMPNLDGIAATARITGSGAPQANAPAILVLTTFEDDDYVFGSLRAGAAGFLLKDATPDVLLGAIRSVASGQSLVDPSVTRRVIERWLDSEPTTPTATSGLGAGGPTSADAIASDLTEREVDVWRALADGASNKEIASALFVSEATVKTHVSTLLSKLGVRSRVQAVIAAYERGLIEPGR